MKNDSIIFGEYVASKLELFDQRTKTMLQHQISSLICNTEINYIHNNPGNQNFQFNINHQASASSANSMSFSSPLSSPTASSIHSMSSTPPQSPYYPTIVQQPSYHMSNFQRAYEYQYQQTPPSNYGTSANVNTSETILIDDLTTTSNL